VSSDGATPLAEGGRSDSATPRGLRCLSRGASAPAAGVARLCRGNSSNAFILLKARGGYGETGVILVYVLYNLT